ncbi:MAG: hypothetical protein ACI8XO_003921 [Verrucomicrobiales bacterium]|jgi:hypothetical protein
MSSDTSEKSLEACIVGIWNGEFLSAFPILNSSSKTLLLPLVELLRIDHLLQRVFYEIECVKSGWSVRELKRQIGSLLFEHLRQLQRRPTPRNERRAEEHAGRLTVMKWANLEPGR